MAKRSNSDVTLTMVKFGGVSAFLWGVFFVVIWHPAPPLLVIGLTGAVAVFVSWFVLLVVITEAKDL